MPQKIKYYLFVALSMGTSLLVSSYLLSSLFIDNNPTPYWDALKQNSSTIASKSLIALRAITSSTQSMKVIPTPTIIPTLTPTQIPPFTPPTATIPQDTTPAQPVIPTSTPVPLPTQIPTQYIFPTSAPTAPYRAPTDRVLPTIKPSIKPSQLPTKTPPKPTIPPDPLLVSGDPLKQPWYGNNSYSCYSPERFYAVYANGLKPMSCFSNIKSAVDSQIVSTTLLGTSIRVHKKALPAFQAVAKALEKYKSGTGTYKFPSKTYKIKNVGAYIFRCNVNSSTSGKFDLCSPGCKLSPHSFGIGVDINTEENCNGCKTFDMPKEISDTFEMYGFRWGGHYPLIGSTIDAMHFEYMKDLCEGV